MGTWFVGSCLADRENCFLSLEDARDKIDAWKENYNSRRPHISLGDLSPVEFATLCIASSQPTADLQQYSKAT